jgi:hypothetical protein
LSELWKKEGGIYIMKAYLTCILYLLVVAICQAILLSSAHALRFDFDDKGEMDEWEVISGQWRVEDGALKGGTDSGLGIIVVGDPEWADYTVEMKVKSVDEPVIFGLVTRLVAPNQYYVVSIVRMDGGARQDIRGYQDGNNQLVQADMPVQEDTWYIETVTCEGNHLQAWADGKEMLEFNHDAYDQGQVGVRVWSDQVEIDYFKVDGPGIPPSPEMAVLEPYDTISTAWGEIKQRCEPYR